MEILIFITIFYAFFFFAIYFQNLEEVAAFQDELNLLQTKLNLLQTETASILAEISEKPEIVPTDTNTLLYAILATGIVAVTVYFLYCLSIESPFDLVIDHSILQTNTILDATKSTGSAIEKLNVDLNIFTSEELVNLSDQLIAILSRIDALETAITLRNASSTQGTTEITNAILVILEAFHKSI